MLLLKEGSDLFNISLHTLKSIKSELDEYIIEFENYKIIVRKKHNVDELYFLLKDIVTDYEIIEYFEFKDILEGRKNV